MSIDLSRPLRELANCVIVPLARFVGSWGHDLFCYGKVINELERVARKLKRLHALIQGMVNDGLVVNEGHLPVWLEEAKTLIDELQEVKPDNKVESDGKLLLMMCLCTRCCNCGEAQKKIEEANRLIKGVRNINLKLGGQAQSGGHSKTHKRSRGEVFERSSSTPDLLTISASHSLAIQLGMEDTIALITGTKTFNLTLGGQAQSGGHSWAEVLARTSSTPAIPTIIDDHQLELEENSLPPI